MPRYGVTRSTFVSSFRGGHGDARLSLKQRRRSQGPQAAPGLWDVDAMVAGGSITATNVIIAQRRVQRPSGGSNMGEIVDLRGRSIPLEDDELIENLARFADGTLSEAAVKSRHHLSNEDWAALGESDKLVELVEACKLRRIRSGATKRERAQIEIVDAPPILGGIMRDPNANERHRIDSIKTLDALASTGAEAAAAGARFEITINLGADHIEHYSKSIAIDPDDTDPNSIDTTDVIAAIAMNKSKDGDNGGHL